jgi:hypothetical protein
MKSRHSIPWTELILFLVLAMFSCQKNDVDSNNKASVYPYTIITKHAWYYFENFDTSYTATNLSDTVSGFPQPPFRKIIPDLSNPCTLSTFYNFNLDGTFTSVDCNGNTKTLGVWRTLSDTSIVNGGTIITPFPLLTITATNGEVYTPFTDTILTNAIAPVFFSMIDSTEMSVYNSSASFWGGPDSLNSTKWIVNDYSGKIMNHIFRYN